MDFDMMTNAVIRRQIIHMNETVRNIFAVFGSDFLGDCDQLSHI